MRSTLALFIPVVLSCGAPLREPGRARAILSEQFSGTTFTSDWLAVTPNIAGATVRMEGGAVILTLPASSDDQVAIKRKIDVSPVRGQRIRLKARVRAEAPPQSSVRATITIDTSAIAPSYHGTATSSPMNSTSWTDVRTVIDVPRDATSAVIDLVLHGPGTAWFENAEVTVVGPAPSPAAIELTSQQVANLRAFTRAVTLIRYKHPSDEVAALDWNAFLPSAIAQMLRAHSQAEVLAVLRDLFKDVAPTVRFTAAGSPPPSSDLPHGEGDHLVRWRRYGLGNSQPFFAYREGRDSDRVSANVSTRVGLDHLKACKRISFRMSGHRLPGTGKSVYFARVLRSGVTQDEVAAPVGDGDVQLATDVASDTQDLEVGLRVEGQSGATVAAVMMSCGGDTWTPVDITPDRWDYAGFTNLYAWDSTTCDHRTCARLQREDVSTIFDPKRDLLHEEIGNGITMHVPLAVWADANHTLPAAAGKPPLADFTIDELPTRLAAIAATWGTVSLFYPYFADQHIDWSAALPAAFIEAAAARSPQDTRIALCHLMFQLRDNHAKVTHPDAPITGILPFAFRRFGNQLVVVGGLPQYLAEIKIGSEVLELDGVPADRVYEQAATQVSAATDGLHEYLVPARMGMGYPGTLHTLRARGRDGRVVDQVVPLVNDNLYAHVNREPRPEAGVELAPGVYYVDLDALPTGTWEKLLPTLEKARAIIIDFRGYVNAATLEVMSHIASRELRTPEWQTPLVPSFAGPRYETGHWGIRPAAPKLNAKIVGLVDGRAMSAVETVLHMFHESKMGVLVGENSGGTNGNAVYVDVPGGFNVRFTGMRAASPDGSTVQGRGFTPDRVVHPTLDGVRAGRDEILEAGLAIAKQLIEP